MRALALSLVIAVGCNSTPNGDGPGSRVPAVTQAGSASTPDVVAADDPRLVGALEGCSAIVIAYGPYRMQAGGGLSRDAKRCAAVIIDERYRRAALALVDKRCAESNARACYIAGALRTEFVTSIGLGAATVDDAKPRFVIRKFNPHAAEVPPRFVTLEDKAEATRLFARACELGDPDGCARPLFDRANAGADATEIIAFACTHGSDYACQLQRAK